MPLRLHQTSENTTLRVGHGPAAITPKEATAGVFWAGIITDVEGDHFTFANQTSANAKTISLKTNSTVSLPAGTYSISYHLNTTPSAAGSTVVLHDSNGPLEVSRSGSLQSSTQPEHFTGHVVKIFANGSTVQLKQSGVHKVRNGSLYIERK